MNGAMSPLHALKSAIHIPAFWILSHKRVFDALAEWKAQGLLNNGG
jgi:hypothetical protein